MIQFYGSPASSAGRTHWFSKKLGVPYEYRRADARDGGTRTPEFLALNPSGKIPFLVDGEFKLFESIAIDFIWPKNMGRLCGRTTRRGAPSFTSGRSGPSPTCNRWCST